MNRTLAFGSHLWICECEKLKLRLWLFPIFYFYFFSYKRWNVCSAVRWYHYYQLLNSKMFYYFPPKQYLYSNLEHDICNTRHNIRDQQYGKLVSINQAGLGCRNKYLKIKHSWAEKWHGQSLFICIFAGPPF